MPGSFTLGHMPFCRVCAHGLPEIIVDGSFSDQYWRWLTQV